MCGRKSEDYQDRFRAAAVRTGMSWISLGYGSRAACWVERQRARPIPTDMSKCFAAPCPRPCLCLCLISPPSSHFHHSFPSPPTALSELDTRCPIRFEHGAGGTDASGMQVSYFVFWFCPSLALRPSLPALEGLPAWGGASWSICSASLPMQALA